MQNQKIYRDYTSGLTDNSTGASQLIYTSNQTSAANYYNAGDITA